MPIGKRKILSEIEAREKLEKINQSHLLKYWEELSSVERENLLHQISKIDLDLFEKEKAEIQKPILSSEKHVPYKKSAKKGSNDKKAKGEELIHQGKCALLVLAGGSGSRLRFEGPKGSFPVSNVKKKSLFQLIAEKVKAASKKAKFPLEMAVMTSPLNHVETETFFVAHGFFGLCPSQVHFFYQDVWPLLDLNGDFFLESKGVQAFGPNGNGGALKRLVEVGLFEKWKEKGIEMINVIPVDNPLADPFDEELFGFHSQEQNEITIKAALRRSPEEKVGVIIDDKGKPSVKEYGEVTLEETQEDVLAYLGLFCVSMNFIDKIRDVSSPLHGVKKAVKMVNEKGDSFFPKLPNAWKFEQFLFDLFFYSSKKGVLCYPRGECFAPLKNFEQEDSISTVSQALLEADRRAYFQVSGIMPSEEVVFELSQEFYYPTKELVEKWQGKALPAKAYIEP